MRRQISRGDVYYADLNPVTGSEQGGIRPVLVVQNEAGNKYSPTIIVVPLTSAKKACLPTHVQMSCVGALRYDSIVLCEQVRTIDVTRLDGYIGRIDEETQAVVDEALGVSMGLGGQLIIDNG